MSRCCGFQALILGLVLLVLMPACSPTPVTLLGSPPPSSTTSISTQLAPDTGESPTPTAPTPAVTQAPAATYSPSITPPYSPTPTTDTFSGRPQPPGERTLYTLEATLDYAHHELVVRQNIRYTNTTPDALVYIPLVIEAYRYRGVFRLSGVYDQAGGKMLTRKEGPYLRLNLTEVLQPGESLEFSLAYT
ncbi:hypothetical protein ACFLZW_07750, partial [Chloroflexota bacterium]